MARATTVAEVIAGEAVSGTPETRMADMRAIASVIANRAALLGVTQQQVISNQDEFNAYNKALPPGVDQSIVDMAQEAIDDVAENGPVNNATFYATPAATGNLPSGLSYEAETAGHQFFSDPQQRSIGTSLGYVQPNQYAYAQNLSESAIPTPYAPNDLTNNSLLSAFSATPTYRDDPFSSILGPSYSAMNQWSDIASTNPISSPMGSVQAEGLLGGVPGLEAQARATPLMAVPASVTLGSNPGLTADAAVTSIASPGMDVSRFDGGAPVIASGFDDARFASAQPDFDQSRFGPSLVNAATNKAIFSTPMVDADATAALSGGLNLNADATATPIAPTFDSSRFATPGTTSRIGPQSLDLGDLARMDPLTGAINPATNTQAFMDVPQQPADLGSFPAGYDTQRGPSEGVNSAEMQAMRGHVINNMNRHAAEDASRAALGVDANGLLGTTPGFDASTTASVSPAPIPDVINPAMQTPNFAQALNPSISPLSNPNVTGNAFAAQPGVMPAAQAINDNFPSAPRTSLFSPTMIASSSGPLSFTPARGILPTQPQQQNAFVSAFPTAVANNTIEPATVNDVVAAPTLESMQVSEQPTVTAQPTTVDGPTTTPAIDQQQTQAVTTKAATTPTQSKGLFNGMINKGTIGGGVLGALAGGPLGGALGALVGHQLAKGGLTNPLGGLSNSFSGPSAFSPPANQIAGGALNIGGLYGGAYSPGTYAVANNGATITAQPNGYTSYVNKYGVNEVVSPTGQISHNFGSLGGLFGGTPDTTTPDVDPNATI